MAKKAAKRATTKTTKTKSPARKASTKARAKSATADVPALFRLNVEVGDLARATHFYETLLGIPGRVQRGARVYFTCGSATLQVVDVSSTGTPHPAAKALYFTVRDLDAAFARAKSLRCLSDEDIHGTSGAVVAVRPWGERSFYAEDPWKNPLCFVEEGTVYAG